MTFDVDQLFAYSPMLILIGMGCVILLAETFVRGQGRAPGWPGWASPAAWRRWWRSSPAGATPPTPTSHFQGMLTVDRMALYLDAAFVVGGAADAAVRAPLPARAGVRVRRVLRAGAVRHRRHGDGRPRHQPGVAAHRHRDHVAGRLRPDRLLAPQPAQRRGGDEVLPDGRLRHRLPASTAWRWSTAPPAASSTYAGSPPRRPTPARCRCSTSASTSSSSRWSSRSPPSRSTCGRPTPTKGRRRR